MDPKRRGWRASYRELSIKNESQNLEARNASAAKALQHEYPSVKWLILACG
jgi:hypothetical protein